MSAVMSENTLCAVSMMQDMPYIPTTPPDPAFVVCMPRTPKLHSSRGWVSRAEGMHS